MPKHSLNSSNFDEREKKKNQYNIIVPKEKYNSFFWEKKEKYN